ncbi:hypothetical protein ElyMa_001557700 [Elysia marginata]|uniref:Uncharacterized protein n=1 Tax=Elysia marginata TaxID=1093978 RepID=A0AAV4JET2_9GAST|nr:hypothetical protein ElyMa_001557700 [Elysia marginata]
MLLRRVTSREKANPTDEQLETPRNQDPKTQPKVYHGLESVFSQNNAQCSRDQCKEDILQHVVCPTKEKLSEEPNKWPKILHPSEFVVEGKPREDIEDPEQEKTQPQCKERQPRKRKLNHGMEYTSESGKLFKNKRVEEPCDVEVCKKRGLSCHRFGEKLRSDFYGGFYQSGQLADQRRWILSYVDVQKPERTKKRKQKRQDNEISPTL